MYAYASKVIAPSSKNSDRRPMDALSDVLQTINLSGVIFLRANLGESYGVSMPPPTISHPSIKPLSDEHRLVMFHIVREGGGFVEVEGFSPQKLEEGDLIVVLDDLYHSIVDSPGAKTIASADLVPDHTLVAAPPAAEVGEGERTMRLVCGMLQFVDRGFNPVFSALPPYLHIPKKEGPSAAWFQANLSHIIDEAESGRPGSDRLLSRLTELLFVETLRTYLESLPKSETGWFAGLKDPMLSKALQLVHENPAHDWSVAELAKRSGASRSAFSARFTDLMGTAPMTYITRWRIRVATNLLEDPGLSMAEIAQYVGYESESAFNRAFKREMGSPPAAWRANLRD
jgi:AraC-like DNA-binding protein